MRRILALWLLELLLLPTLALAQGETPVRIKDGVAGQGEADVTSGRLLVDPSGVTSPVSAASLPLPTGAATEATLGTLLLNSTLTGRFPAGGTPADNESNSVTLSIIRSYLYCFDGSTWDRCPGNSTDGLLVNLGANNDVTVTGTVSVSNYDGIVRDGTGDTTQANVSSGRLHVDGSGVTQPISAASLPLPTGAATAANQDGIIRDGAGDTTQANVSSGRLHVDGSGVTQPVSGTVTANQGGAPWSVAGPAADGAAVSGNPVRIGGKDGSGNTQDIATDTSGELQVDVLTLPSVTIGSFPDNEPFNVAQFGGSAVATGTGTGGAGIPRVTVSNDSAVRVWDGTNTASVNGSNQLAVNCGNCTGSGVSQQDKTGFTAGSGNMVPVGGYRDDTSPSTLAEGEAGAARLTENRAFHVNLRDASGNEVSAGGGTQYDEDTAHNSGDKLTLAGVVRNDAGTALAADQDRTVLQVDSTGALRVSGGASVQTASDTITADEDTSALALSAGINGAGVTITGTWVATLIPEVSLDGGTTWSATDLWSIAGEAMTQSITANGQFVFPFLAGVSNVRVRADAYTSGTATVAFRATSAPSVPPWGAERPPGGSPPTHAMYAGGTDGTNLRGLKTDTNGELQVDILTLPTATVAGTAADGAAVSGNPVRIGGKDGSGNTQDIATDTSGELQVDVLSLPANASVNVAQFGGSATVTGTGASGSGIPRVTVSNDSAVRIRDDAGNEIKSSTGRPLNADRGLTVRQPIACTQKIAISQTADTQLITGTSGQRVYFCAIFINANAAETWNLIEGTGSVCATSPTAIIGSTTEGSGVSSAAQGGVAMATGVPFMQTGVDTNNVCLTQVGSSRITGFISYEVAAND
jgi:hypothetical protein